ncbi:hypothetical protein D3C78_1623380 [compost metagenome]
MMRSRIEHNILLVVRHCFGHNAQKSFHRLVKHLNRQTSCLDSLDDLLIRHTVHSWHFQLQSGLQAAYTVIHCAPV